MVTVEQRVYVGDLRRLGFPFREKRVGKKLLIGIDTATLERLLAAKVLMRVPSAAQAQLTSAAPDVRLT